MYGYQTKCHRINQSNPPYPIVINPPVMPEEDIDLYGEYEDDHYEEPVR